MPQLATVEILEVYNRSRQLELEFTVDEDRFKPSCS